MKKFIIILAILITGIFLFSKTGTKENSPILGDSYPEDKVLTDPVTVNKYTLSHEDRDIEIYYFEADPRITSLNSNFKERLPASQLLENSTCRALVNGGFYKAEAGETTTLENAPLGLFVSSGNKLSGFHENQTLDGILSVNEFGVASISREPKENVIHAVQTGPILKENNSFPSLKIRDDEPDRRMAAAVTGQNTLVFFAFIDKKSSFSGPLLADLPNLMEKFEQESGFEVADVINLDGGAASAFYAGDVTISEASPIGSYWCVK